MSTLWLLLQLPRQDLRSVEFIPTRELSLLKRISSLLRHRESSSTHKHYSVELEGNATYLWFQTDSLKEPLFSGLYHYYNIHWKYMKLKICHSAVETKQLPRHSSKIMETACPRKASACSYTTANLAMPYLRRLVASLSL